jgi:hypothetical protein
MLRIKKIQTRGCYFVGVGSVYVYLSGEAGDIGKLGR